MKPGAKIIAHMWPVAKTIAQSVTPRAGHGGDTIALLQDLATTLQWDVKITVMYTYTECDFTSFALVI